MKDSNLDLFDPRTAVMESAAYSPSSSSRDPDFGFAFDDSNFSDRILRIEVLADDSSETHSGTDACQTLADWARYRKRPREDVKKHDALDITICPEEQILNCNQHDTDDVAECENQEVEEFTMIEESPLSGDEAANSDDLDCDMDTSRVL